MNPIGNRDELIDRMIAGREAFEETLAQIDPQRLHAPLLANGWSGKDVLAHVGWWAHYVSEVYEMLANGEQPEEDWDALDDEAINARVYEEWKDQPLELVLDFEQAAFEDSLDVARFAPQDDLFDGERFEWTNGRPLHTFVDYINREHYADHLRDLETLVTG